MLTKLMANSILAINYIYTYILGASIQERHTYPGRTYHDE